MSKIYQTITFENKSKCWGYPLPHLLSMHRQLPQFDQGFGKDPNIDSQIELIFSTEKVVIRGKALAKLWEKLVMQQDLKIEVGDDIDGYTVKTITPYHT